MESSLVTAQRNTIQEARGRFERGEISLETFREALDALTQARSPEECEMILGALPVSTHGALAALEPSAPPAPPPAAGAGQPAKRIVAFMAETRKTRRPWVLAPETQVTAVMGEVNLDLRHAQLPSAGRLVVKAIMGEVTLYVPQDVWVTVRSSVVLGEAKALGESVGGVVASGHEEHIPEGTPARARLEMDVTVIMGEVKVILVDQANVTITEFARETLASVMEGFRRGIASGSDSDSTREQPRRIGD